jgi:ATP-binding cassette subfamily C protein EexD
MTAPARELASVLSACRQSLVAIGVFSLCANLLLLVPSFYMLQVYDRVVATGSEATLAALTVIMLLLMGTYGVLEWVRSRIMVRLSNRMDNLLGERLFDASFHRALTSSGNDVSAQPLQDLTGLRQFLTGNGLFAFFDVPWLPLYLGVMFLFHPLFGWVGVASAVILGLLAVVNEGVTRGPLRDANAEHIAASSYTGKTLRNAEVIAALGMLRSVRDRWRAANGKVLMLQARASERAANVTATSKTFRLIVQSLILGVGAWLAVRQEISPGVMIAGSILLGRALAPLDLMINVWKGFVTARGQYQRLNELLKKMEAEPDRMDLPAPRGNMTVESLLLAAPGSRQPILRDVSFAVKAGDAVGILGPSASGKSTLARALLGIWSPMAGCVRLDGADITSWNREALGPYIGYLPQDVELFEGTVSENIARFGAMDPVAVVTAARMAGVHDMILRLPNGYDTIIGAQAGSLSGGQRQRIGLARALYGQPPLVVLDEPNSNLDDTGERALAAALVQLKTAGCTVFVITHRVGVLAQLEKLLVLQEGRVAIFGPRDLVLAQLQAGARPGAAVSAPQPAAAPPESAP